MTLAVGDLCTVVHSDGGFRVALPVERAGVGQLAYLTSAGSSDQGIPLRIRTIDEIAATVPESDAHPRLPRVVGTLVRDSFGAAVFAPLDVLAVSSVNNNRGAKTIFVVFADSSPFEAETGVTSDFTETTGTVPYPAQRRRPGQWDLFFGEDARPDGTGDSSKNASPYAFRSWYVGSGQVRLVVLVSPITIATFIRTSSFDGPEKIRYRTVAMRVGSTFILSALSPGESVSTGQVRVRALAVWDPYLAMYTGEVAWSWAEGNYALGYGEVNNREFYTDPAWLSPGITAYRRVVEEASWPTSPAALLFHLPKIDTDVRGNTIYRGEQLIPSGVDPSPLVIYPESYSAGLEQRVAGTILQKAGVDGVRDVRYIVSVSTLDALERLQATIAGVQAIIEGQFAGASHAISNPDGSDWLGALIAEAESVSA